MYREISLLLIYYINGIGKKEFVKLVDFTDVNVFEWVTGIRSFRTVVRKCCLTVSIKKNTL